MAAQDYEQVTYNSPDGAQVGAATTEKVGFWGATPITQRAAAALSTVAALSVTAAISTGGAGFTTSAGLQQLVDAVAEIRAAMVAMGIHKGAA